MLNLILNKFITSVCETANVPYLPIFIFLFCYNFAEPDANNKHWLQIDLGREFEVKKLAIFNIGYGSDIILDLVDRKYCPTTYFNTNDKYLILYRNGHVPHIHETLRYDTGHDEYNSV